MPKIHIDDREIEAGERENLIDAATRIGVHIPHFCYHAALSVAGNCRQCMVEVEGIPKPQIACNTPLKDGMRIRTQTPAILEARRGVLEFLLLNHPIDCPVCDQAGECYLQEYYMQHGLYDSRRNVDKVHKPKVVNLGPLVVLDAERCVLCSRCVRFCQEIAKVEELYIKERGNHCEIATFPGKDLANPYSGCVVDICPVGALLSRDFRFKCRVWWLKKADSVCTRCARGCNVRIDHNWNQVQRQVPRCNPEVNSYWMCDRGRVDYKWINENRLVEAQAGARQVPLREALDRLCERLAEAQGDVAVLLSPKLANEDLLVLRHLFTAVYAAKALAGGSLEPPEVEDDVLRRADPHPNSWMLQALGLATDVRRFVRESGARALLLFGDDPLAHDPALGETLRNYEFVAAALTNRNATAMGVASLGGILLPLATHAEYAGTFTNFEGRVQRFAPALSLYGAALPAHELGLEIANTLGRPIWPQEKRSVELLEGIWGELAPADLPFPKVSWKDVPRPGIVPEPQPTASPARWIPSEVAGWAALR